MAEAARLLSERYRLPPEEARKLVVEGLRSGEVGAVVVDVWGARRPAKADDFRSGKLEFESPRILSMSPALSEGEAESVPALVADEGEPDAWSLGVAYVLAPRIEINLLSLFRFADAILGGGRDGIEAARSKDRGGRPPVHRWRLAMRQVLLRLRDHGWPATKGELVAELGDWFGRTFDDVPDQRTLERFVSDIWPQGPCDLRPRE